MNNYTNEIWKDVLNEGFENYEVSNLGNIRNKKSKKLRKLQDNGNGYKCIAAQVNGKNKNLYLHIAVATAFIPNDDPINKTQVSHLDESRDNNRADNLSWVSPKENCNMPLHCKRMSISKGTAVRCLETNQCFCSAREAERQTGINYQGISKCCQDKQKTAGGKHWVFEEDYQNMLVAELLEIAFCGEENEPEETDGTDGSELVSICGVPLNDYLAMNEAI